MSFKPRGTTKKSQQPALHKTVYGLSKLTALQAAPNARQKVDTKRGQSQQIKKPSVAEKAGKVQGVLKTKNEKMVGVTKTTQEQCVNAPKNELIADSHEEMDTDLSSAREAKEKVASTKKERVRTLTPQPMDVTEMAGEIQRKLQLVEDVDEEDKDNPLFCTEYVQDIYRYLNKLEVRGLVQLL